MNKKIFTILSSALLTAALVLSGCTSGTTAPVVETAVPTATQTSQSAQVTPVATGQTSAPSAGNPPSGTPPGGNPPSGAAPAGAAPSGGNTPGNSSGSSSTVQGLSTASGAYTLDGKTASQTGQKYTAAKQDESAIYVLNAGKLTISNATISTTGNSSSNDNSSFYGLNAGVLAAGGSTINMTDSTVTTSGSGANGVFATGNGSTVTLTNVTIKASGGGAHGAMASDSGTLNLTDVNIATSGASSAPIATDRGGGTITVSGGTTTTSGQNSPCLYSTGNFTVTGLTCTATGSESAVIEGANAITLTNSSLTSSVDNKWGVMIYQSMSGDTSGNEGKFNMTGGTLANTATTGPLFFVTNTTAYITLKGVTINAGSGTLLEAAGTDQWGTSGSNGGTAIFTADGQSLSGDMLVDKISSLTLVLQNSSSLSGAINTANTARLVNLTLDSSSTWNVTADSYLTCLADTGGISGTSVSNITGNGHTVYYNSSACSSLNSQTYTLNGGGYLKPAS